MEEVWKPISGYENYYEVSSLGRIRSVDRYTKFVREGLLVNRKTNGYLLSQTLDGKGNYLQVNLSKNGKSKSELVHRIVAKAFIENPNNLPEVNHKDENKTNNAVSNLEWCDHYYNNHYGTKETASRGMKNSMNKFDEDTILKIKQLYIPYDKEYGITGLARKFNISQSHVCSIVKGRRWGWLDASSGS